MGQTGQRESGTAVAPAGGVPAGPRSPCPAGSGSASAADRRADGYARTVSLSRDCIRIDRRLSGIAMRVAVPVRAYRGVTLSLLPDAAGVLRYQLHLLHRDDDLSVLLGCAGTDLDIVADWRLWSRFFRLPALVERQDGRVEEADATLGGLPVGRDVSARRRSRLRSKHRPAFLARRKAGDLALTVTVHAGEREIIART